MTLTELKRKHPTATYEDSGVYDGEEQLLTEEEAKNLIEEHYNMWKAEIPHPSGSPILATMEPVSGQRYIELELWGDYAEAFNQI